MWFHCTFLHQAMCCQHAEEQAAAVPVQVLQHRGQTGNGLLDYCTNITKPRAHSKKDMRNGPYPTRVTSEASWPQLVS